MPRTPTALILVLGFFVLVPVAEAADGVMSKPFRTSSLEDAARPHNPAFLAGVDSGGAIALTSCIYPYACPARCDCINGIGTCYYESGSQCRIDVCETGITTGCKPVP